MERFNCNCESKPELFFDSTSCVACGRLTGFCDESRQTAAFETTQTPAVFRCSLNGKNYVQCANYRDHNVCNGMVMVQDGSAGDPGALLCFACHFNNTIPDLSVAEHLPLWKKMESAKRRAFYTLTGLGLALPDKKQDPKLGLSFEFITDRDAKDHFQSELPNMAPVFTGHDEGTITINLAEADDVARASTKVGLAENYRTLLGHFRHEIGHYYWDRLIAPNESATEAFRALFGDETESYQDALDRHYSSGPPANWSQSYISAYATMHPWEDWAETWAHYLHMIDTLETAQAYGFEAHNPTPPAQPNAGSESIEQLNLPQDSPTAVKKPYSRDTPVEQIIDAWVQFSIGLNALNRSMGLEDAYPFVLTPAIRDKIGFVHKVIYDGE